MKLLYHTSNFLFVSFVIYFTFWVNYLFCVCCSQCLLTITLFFFFYYSRPNILFVAQLKRIKHLLYTKCLYDATVFSLFLNKFARVLSIITRHQWCFKQAKLKHDSWWFTLIQVFHQVTWSGQYLVSLNLLQYVHDFCTCTQKQTKKKKRGEMKSKNTVSVQKRAHKMLNILIKKFILLV